MATKPATPKKPAPKAKPQAKPAVKKAPVKKPVDETKPAKAPVKKTQTKEEVKVIREEVKAAKAASLPSDIDAMSAVAMLPATQPAIARAITTPGEKGEYVVNVVAPKFQNPVREEPKRITFADLETKRRAIPRQRDTMMRWKTK